MRSFVGLGSLVGYVFKRHVISELPYFTNVMSPRPIVYRSYHVSMTFQDIAILSVRILKKCCHIQASAEMSRKYCNMYCTMTCQHLDVMRHPGHLSFGVKHHVMKTFHRHVTDISNYAWIRYEFLLEIICVISFWTLTYISLWK